MKFTVPNPSLEITFANGNVLNRDDAVLEIKKDGETLVAVVAVIGREQGADGSWYNVVKFERFK